MGAPWLPSEPKPKPKPDEKPAETVSRLYCELRVSCHELEQALDKASFTGKELKRLDKAITVMKAGFKIVKKVVRNEAKKPVTKLQVVA